MGLKGWRIYSKAHFSFETALSVQKSLYPHVSKGRANRMQAIVSHLNGCKNHCSFEHHVPVDERSKLAWFVGVYLKRVS